MHRLTGAPRKNDALFQFGSLQKLPFVYAYRQENTEIVYGPSCKVRQEVLMQCCAADNISLYPRRGGGGTVVLSPGMVITVVVGERRMNQSIQELFSSIHRPMIALLQGMANSGRIISERGLSDLAIEDQKICGSSLYLGNHPDLFYYQSSLMVDSDPELIGRYLAHPPREPDYRGGRTHRAFCTTMREQGWSSGAAEVAELFNAKLRPALEG